MKTKKNYNIYLVDDDPMYLSTLERLVIGQEPDIHVKSFPTGEDCLESFGKKIPDAVVLDYYLKGVENNAMDGIHILNKIKTTYRAVPVIMISAQTKIEIAVNCIKNGALDFIIKNENAPFKLKLHLHQLISGQERKNKIRSYEHWNMAMAALFLVFLTGMVIYAYQHN
ncbi:MAG TPA: response regulator [Bacteroidia bacterium]|jgi:DNA-binding NtrC family response regulator|nr:response regulator [Bacteroidia bacterium]